MSSKDNTSNKESDNLGEKKEEESSSKKVAPKLNIFAKPLKQPSFDTPHNFAPHSMNSTNPQKIEQSSSNKTNIVLGHESSNQGLKININQEGVNPTQPPQALKIVAEEPGTQSNPPAKEYLVYKESEESKKEISPNTSLANPNQKPKEQVAEVSEEVNKSSDSSAKVQKGIDNSKEEDDVLLPANNDKQKKKLRKQKRELKKEQQNKEKNKYVVKQNHEIQKQLKQNQEAKKRINEKMEKVNENLQRLKFQETQLQTRKTDIKQAISKTENHEQKAKLNQEYQALDHQGEQNKKNILKEQQQMDPLKKQLQQLQQNIDKLETYQKENHIRDQVKNINSQLKKAAEAVQQLQNKLKNCQKAVQQKLKNEVEEVKKSYQQIQNKKEQLKKSVPESKFKDFIFNSESVEEKVEEKEVVQDESQQEPTKMMIKSQKPQMIQENKDTYKQTQDPSKEAIDLNLPKTQQSREKKQQVIPEIKIEEKKQQIPLEEKGQRSKKDDQYNDPIIQSFSAELQSLIETIKDIKVNEQVSLSELQQQLAFNHKAITTMKIKRKQLEDYENKIQDRQDVLNQGEQFLTVKRLYDKTARVIKQVQTSLTQSQGMKRAIYDRQMRKKQQQFEELEDFQIDGGINPRFKPFYEDEMNKLRPSLGPQSLRFMMMYQKYVNQLRVLVELNRISEEELIINHFDRRKYQSLVARKTQLFDENPIPVKINQKMLSDQKMLKMIETLEEIQAQLTPMQDNFDQSYIKGLYKIPKESLVMTKQSLFELSQQKINQAYQKQLDELKKGNMKLNQELKVSRARRVSLEQEEQRCKQNAENVLLTHQKQQQRMFFPGRDENKLINRSQFQTEYRVIVQNEEELNKMYQQLNDDSKLKQVTQALDMLKKQREKEKENHQIARRDFYAKVEEKKRNKRQDVYMGDPVKVSKMGNVHELEQKLNQLKQQLSQIQAIKKRPSSKISYLSQIQMSCIMQ